MSFFAPQHRPHHHMCIATKSKVCHELKSRGDMVKLLTHQDSHLLLAKEPAKDTGESEPHPVARKEIWNRAEVHSWATAWWRLQKVWCGRPAPSSQRRPFSKVSSEAMQTPCRIYWNLKPMAASSQDRFGFGSPGLCCLIQDILPSETDGFQDKCW